MTLPISAILPIFNCRERLERHLRSVSTWAGTVREIIVVDSGSSDGSLELAREALTPFEAKFLHNPPGLYQSWNVGIATAISPWCYISTVEDPITQEGLDHLLGVITRHDADVVISPPNMRNHDGTESASEKMPSNRLAEAFQEGGLADQLLGKAETISMLCGFLPHGLLGSSASNLYRTSFLQQHPFPTTFGHCGDTAWGVSVAPFVKAAFTPRPCAQFYCQTSFRAENPDKQLLRHKQLAELARSTLLREATQHPSAAVMLGWFDAYNSSSQTLWNWLAAEHAYQKLYREMKEKYEGGILQYLRRALRDEWKKHIR